MRSGAAISTLPAVELARHNAQLAEVDDIVRFEAADARTFHWAGCKAGSSPILPTASALWSAGRQRSCTAPSERHGPSSRDLKLVSLLSSHTEFKRTFGKTADRKRKLYNGMLKCVTCSSTASNRRCIMAYRVKKFRGLSGMLRKLIRMVGLPARLAPGRGGMVGEEFLELDLYSTGFSTPRGERAEGLVFRPCRKTDSSSP